VNAATLLHALAFAAERHRRQRRKDAEASPYINHPIAVAAVLADAGGVTDESLLVAAVLHDTVEDTETSFDDLLARFGATVTDLVREVTDDKSLPKQRRKQLQIEHAASGSPRAKQLKIADKICNLRDIASSPPADWSVARCQEYLDWAQAVVAGCRGVNAALDRTFDQALAEAHSTLATLGEPEPLSG
jgi:guanosine-3',5'-bis(diphosphate) 3'-pyrophosphohydrolase